MSAALPLTLALCLVANVAVALFVLRHRGLGRLAARLATARPAQSLLVATGLAVATCALTAGLVAADSVDRTSLGMVERSWGAVDLTVAAGHRLFPADVADRLAGDPEVAAVTDGVAAGLDVTAALTRSGARSAVPDASLTGLNPGRQAPFGDFLLDSGRTVPVASLGPDQALVSRLLATRLDLHAGDRLDVRAAGPQGRVGTLRVAGVVSGDGPGGWTLGPVAFVRLDTAQRLAGRPGSADVVRVSVPGAGDEALAAARRAEPVLTAAVARLGADVALEVRAVKAADLRVAQLGTTVFRLVLVTMSSLVAAVGAMLVVNLVSMLALERRPQLAALRAFGLRRRGLVGLAVTECLLYGWAGALAGAAAGALMGRVLAGGVADIFAAYLDGRSDAPFRYELRPLTLLAGAAAGTVLTLAVAAVTARRTARLDIAAGLRDTPDPPAADVRAGKGRRAARLLATAVLVGAGVALLVPPYLPRLAGGVVLVLVAARLARRALPVRPRVSLAALAVAAWSVVQLAGSSPDDDAAGWVGLFVAAVLVTSFALTVLVAANLDLAELAVAVLGGASARTAAILKPALAYPARRPVRTGLTAGVFAVVVAVLTEFAVLEGGAGSADPGREASEFDVVVRTPGTQVPPLADGVRAEVDRSLVLLVRTYVGPLGSDEPFAGAERAVLPLVRAGADLAEHPPFRLAARDPRFPDDAAAWRAVAADASLAISASGAVGETVTLRGDAGPVGLTVVGTPPDELLGGVFVSGATLERFRTAAPGVLRLLDVRPGGDADRVAADAGAAVAGVGGQAGTIAADLDRTARANRAWVDMLGLLMRLGLLVGVVGLSIVSLRTARERRPLIGMLRALGWTRRQVVAGLLVESTVVTTLGTAVGVVTGLVTGWALARTDGTAAGFTVDLPALAATVAVIHLSALAVTVLPTRRAGGFPPAAALRATG